MTGYTPLFSSLATGTLCGKWPDVGLWPIILSLSDRHGVVDVTHDFLSMITGLPLTDVRECMKRFCEPDPGSRSANDHGARLMLIDARRDWGWRIVNHQKYREKARLQARDADRTASGKDAERKRAARKAASQTLPDFHQQVIDAYHELLPDLPRVKGWSKGRRQALDARIAERQAENKPADQIGYWRSLFAKVAESDFLCGRANDFKADLEWLLRPNNFLKVIEGRYANSR